MSNQKNGALPKNSEDIFAQAMKEVRKKTQGDNVKSSETSKDEDRETEFNNDDKKIKEEEDPETLVIMEKIKSTTYNMKRNYSEIVVGAESFLLGLDKKTRPFLDVKPSVLDGLTSQEDEDLRFLGAEIIQTMVYLLKVPMIVGETACIFFQRFYGVQSFVKYPMEHIVMAAVLLATKVEEAPRRPREIITIFDRLKKLYQNKQDRSIKIDILKIDHNYVMIKNQVVNAERRLLFNLGFVCQIKHPHGYVFCYLKSLCLAHNERILNTSWASMNDCMKTDLFLRYYPKTIAAACVVRTCQRSDPEFELPVINGFHWYEVYGVSSRDVNHIIEVLDKLYERKDSPDWDELMKIVAEARRKKFGLEKVDKVSEEEAKRAINEEENEKKENGHRKTYSKKLGSPEIDDRHSRSRDLHKHNKDKYRDRDRRKERSKSRDRSYRERYDKDRGRKRSRSRSRGRDRRDERKRERDKDRRRHRSRSRSPRSSKLQK